MNDTVTGGDAGTDWSEGIEVHEAEVPEANEETPAEPQADEPKPDQPKKKQGGFQRKAERAQRELDQERQRASALEARLAALEGKPKEAKPDELAPPNPNDYETLYDLNQAQIEYGQKLAEKKAGEIVDTKLKSREEETQKQNFQKDVVSKANAFDDMMAENHPETLKKIEELGADGDFTAPMAFHLINSVENKAEVAEYLVGMDSLEKFAQMTPVEVKAELRAIDLFLGMKGKSENQALRTTKAGAPIQQVRKSGSAARSPLDMSLSELDKDPRWKK